MTSSIDRALELPTEATASGNVLVQSIAAREVTGLAEARQIVRNSFDAESFKPNPSPELESIRARFDQLCGNAPL